MLKKLGYKKGDILEFNQKRNCGLWLIIIGAVIGVSTFFGGVMYINPIIFFIGYAAGFYVSYMNSSIRAKFSSDGSISDFQQRISGVGTLCLFILLFFLGGSFIPGWNWRMIWLGVLLATGLHFFVFYYVHGKSMIAIGLLCSGFAILGMFSPGIPFLYFGYIDASIKVMFGIYLLVFSKPTTTKLK